MPLALIAQVPLPRRDASRLLRLNRARQEISHHTFLEFPGMLRTGDLLVFNDTKVVPARLFGKKIPSGGKVELLLLEKLSPILWRTLVSASGKIAAGMKIALNDSPAQAVLQEADSEGIFTVEFLGVENFSDHLNQIGQMPLPPYIERAADSNDRDRYQTIFARNEGAVAAPTAGLHFTPQILEALHGRGVETASLTLHVGLGTFRPVKTERLEDHVMHSEKFSIPQATLEAITRARQEHRRVIAVGTTVVRALESTPLPPASPSLISSSTSIFIHPPYVFGNVSAILTNFHLPRSTLLMLVSAFAGRDLILEAYRAAIAKQYRFFSYGDCMLIE